MCAHPMADANNRPASLLKGVYSMKFSKPSKIQSVALPLILAKYVALHLYLLLAC